MILKNLTYFQERENLEGKKDQILIIDCNKCSEKDKNFYTNKKCISCLLNSLYLNRNRKISYISLLWNEILIKSNQLELFLEYFKRLKKINKINQKIENTREKKCKFEEFKCKIFPNFSFYSKIQDFEYYDPIFVYNIVNKRYTIFKKKTPINLICQKCCEYLKNLEIHLHKLLDSLEIIKNYKNFQTNWANSQNKNNFYEYLLSKSSLFKKKTKELSVFDKTKNVKLLQIYNIGKDGIFSVSIYKMPYEYEKRYVVDEFFRKKAENDYFEKIIRDIIRNINIVELNQITPLETLITIYKKEILNYLRDKYSLSKVNKKKIGFIAVLRKLNLDKLFPLLIDDLIEEIFLDSPNDFIYLNHQTFGRCRTEIKFNLKEIERIKTLFRLYSGRRLDFMNPNIKFVINNKYFHCRFSVDVEPIQRNNFALDIRKLDKNILTIQDLLKNETLDSLMAAFLYFNIIHRKNITVTGETDTGKTTLINALDLLVPKEFRKIYIENVQESLNQLRYGKHQLKYKADSLEEAVEEKYSKSNQIKTLLHRSPDIIYLGEILTKEEAEAMFHCLAAGLRGFQTIHSNDIDSLIIRILYHFKLSESCLNDLDLIILMKKIFNRRRIVSISEISRKNEKNKLFKPIFLYNPESSKWSVLKSLYETNVIADIRKYKHLTRESFMQFIKIYEEIFNFIFKLKKIENMVLINFFHKISYFSLKSVEGLRFFWNRWKNDRSLNL